MDRRKLLLLCGDTARAVQAHVYGIHMVRCGVGAFRVREHGRRVLRPKGQIRARRDEDGAVERHEVC